MIRGRDIPGRAAHEQDAPGGAAGECPSPPEGNRTHEDFRCQCVRRSESSANRFSGADRSCSGGGNDAAGRRAAADSRVVTRRVPDDLSACRFADAGDREKAGPKGSGVPPSNRRQPKTYLLSSDVKSYAVRMIRDRARHRRRDCAFLWQRRTIIAVRPNLCQFVRTEHEGEPTVATAEAHKPGILTL